MSNCASQLLSTSRVAWVWLWGGAKFLLCDQIIFTRVLRLRRFTGLFLNEYKRFMFLRFSIVLVQCCSAKCSLIGCAATPFALRYLVLWLESTPSQFLLMFCTELWCCTDICMYMLQRNVLHCVTLGFSLAPDSWKCTFMNMRRCHININRRNIVRVCLLRYVLNRDRSVLVRKCYSLRERSRRGDWRLDLRSFIEKGFCNIWVVCQLSLTNGCQVTRSVMMWLLN